MSGLLSSTHRPDLMAHSSLPLRSGTKSVDDGRNSSTSFPPPAPAPKRSRPELDWSAYERATQASQAEWKRKRLEREAASRQTQKWASNGSSISETSALLPSLQIAIQHSSPPEQNLATPTTLQRNASITSDPPPPTPHRGAASPVPPHPKQVDATTRSLPQAGPPTQVTVVDDDDDAFLKQLMAQANQMRQVEQRLGDQLDACWLDPNKSVQIKQGPIDIMADTRDERRQKAIKFLETTLLGFLDDLNESMEALNEYEMNRKSKTKKVKRKLGGDGSQEQSSSDSEKKVGVEMKLKNRSNGGEQVVSYPDDPVHPPKTPSMVRMARHVRVIQLLYEAVLTGCVTTKRDMYYKDVQLFQTQSVVDKLVDDIVATAGLQRQDFMVCATAKGLVASSTLQIHLRSGEQLALSASNASLIPPVERIAHLQAERGVNWVLIVEKDAVFQTLLGLGLLGQPESGHGVLITGKGYPDLATLQLCHLIRQTFPSVAFHALVDADPHGIDIMQVYARGSRSTKHSHDHAGLALGDCLTWMGVKASQWSSLGVKHDDLIHLTEDDVNKAMAMLRRRDLSWDCKRELQTMLHLNRKAEIQILSSTESTDTVHESLFGEAPQSSTETTRKTQRGGLLGYVVAGLMGEVA